MAELRACQPESFRCSTVAGMVIRTSSRNSAINMLEHTCQKGMLTHTLSCHPRNSLEGCLANIRMRILQMFRNGRNGSPDILLKFTYRHPSAHPPESGANTYPAPPALKGARWQHFEHTNQDSSCPPQWQEC